MRGDDTAVGFRLIEEELPDSGRRELRYYLELSQLSRRSFVTVGRGK